MYGGESHTLRQICPALCLIAVDIERPTLRSGEVLVEIKASAINPSDVGNVAGAFQAELPRVPGRDFAGVVVEGGGDEWNGKEVWGSGAGLEVKKDGSHVQYVSDPAGLALGKARQPVDGGSLCGPCSLSRFLEGAGRRGGHSKWRDSADYRRCRSRRPSGHTNRPLDGCDSDRRRSWRQAAERRHVHQHQGQGSRRRGQAPDQQQRAWIWCSMLSAARCSSRRSNRSASAEGRWRSRASAAGASNSI